MSGRNPGVPPRVFVSYSHDSPEHKDLVLEFATFLRREAGVDVRLDSWDDYQRRDWSLWAIEQLTEADFILVIASPEYKRRADGTAAADEGRGAQFEAAIIRDGLTRDLRAETRRVLPVVLPGRSIDEIPVFLAAHSTTRYEIEEFTTEGVNDLLAAFSGVSEHTAPERGEYIGPRFGRRAARSAHSGARGAAEPVRAATVSSRGKVRLLTDALNPIVHGPDLSITGAELNGIHYGNSIVHRCSTFCKDSRSPMEYNLRRAYRGFESVVGILDDAVDAEQIAYFQVFLDGEAQKQVEVAYGEPVRIRYDISDVLRLRLVAYRPDTVTNPMLAGAGAAVGRSARLPALAWGNPTLST
ncbi:SEFIR domain-containing protein [Nocardia sp. NPDC057353]|uniref:SEFIR domain-containing protein n=1 Tax=Nocardia sp. NPDC057353 TaxID=3346104 RepID=UPI00362F4C43